MGVLSGLKCRGEEGRYSDQEGTCEIRILDAATFSPSTSTVPSRACYGEVVCTAGRLLLSICSDWELMLGTPVIVSNGAIRRWVCLIFQDGGPLICNLHLAVKSTSERMP